MADAFCGKSLKPFSEKSPKHFAENRRSILRKNRRRILRKIDEAVCGKIDEAFCGKIAVAFCGKIAEAWPKTQEWLTGACRKLSPICVRVALPRGSRAGLPDGIFSNQNSQFG
jgi:hypothetical protein